MDAQVKVPTNRDDFKASFVANIGSVKKGFNMAAPGENTPPFLAEINFVFRLNLMRKCILCGVIPC